jgi:hypothetical protein
MLAYSPPFSALTPVLTPQLIALLSLSLAACMAIYNIFFVPSRADRAAVEARLHKLEVSDANHETRLAGFQQATEKLADGIHQRCQAIENQLGEVGRMREDMAGVKAELKHVVDGYHSINNKLDRLLERQSK